MTASVAKPTGGGKRCSDGFWFRGGTMWSVCAAVEEVVDEGDEVVVVVEAVAAGEASGDALVGVRIRVKEVIDEGDEVVIVEDAVAAGGGEAAGLSQVGQAAGGADGEGGAVGVKGAARVGDVAAELVGL